MIKINLLPPEKRKKLKKVKPAKKKAPAIPQIKLALKFDPYVVVPAAAAVVSVLLIGGSFFWLGHKEKSIKEARNQMRVELNLLNQVINRIKELKAQTKDVQERMEVILEVDKNRFLWPRILDEISGALPSYSWLESISETSPFPQLRLRLEGTTMSNILLSRFLKNLEQSSLLTDIKLISSAERSYGSYETKFFVIECDCALNEPPDTTRVAARQ